MRRRTDAYFERFGFLDRQIDAPAPAGLSLSVVIPCFNEANLVGALESLRRCEAPKCVFEIIVVINAPAGAPKEALAQNCRTMEEARTWIADTGFAVHLIDSGDLPPRH